MSMRVAPPTETNLRFGLVDFVLVISRHGRLMVFLPLVLTAAALIYVFAAAEIFQSEVVLMPPQQQTSSMANLALSALGGGEGGAASLLGLKNPNDMYVGLLQTQAIGRVIVNKYHLVNYYAVRNFPKAFKQLGEATTITAGKDNLIYISVEDADRKLAADIANTYASELQNVLNLAAEQEARPRLEYFDRLMKETLGRLADKEDALKQMQEKSGAVDIDAQGKATVIAMGELHDAIAALDVQIQSTNTYATTHNPDLQMLRAEKIALEAQLKQLSSGTINKDDVLVVKSRTPALNEEFLRRLRDIKYYDALLEMVARQYEAARMDDAKRGAVVQVVEKGLPGEERYRPKRGLIVGATAVSSVFLAALIAFILENSERDTSEQTRAKWAEIQANVLGRRKP